MEKNNKKVTTAWCFYDWANSVYSLVITTAIFPIYYVAVTTQADGTDLVNFLGWTVSASVLYKYALTGAFLAIALCSPILTAIADYGGNKKAFMRFFCYLGSFACMGLFFFNLQTFSLSVLLFMVAAIGYSGSIVFYNAYLPEIATEDQFDKLSARGFSLGYIGSMILLIVSLVMVLMPDLFGITDKSMAPRISFLMTGLWWFGFAHYSFAYLPQNPYHKKPEGHYLFNGFKELKKVWHKLGELPSLKRFLLAFFFYNMGVQTVMYVASLFGSKELHLTTESLIVAVIIWVGISIGAYFITTGNQYYALAFVVGAVMGGIQALSRSTYSKLLPPTTDHASFFSFYDICDKVGLALGSLAFGLTEQWFGSMRNSVLVLSVFFVFGMIVLTTIKIRKTEPQPQMA